MSHALRFGKYPAQRDIEPLNNIGAMILDELLAIPADATTATIQGVEMQIISAEQADQMLKTVISNERAEMLLNNDAEDEKTHECILKNGRFLFESENGELKALYKVHI